MALAQETEAILMDEPTTFLDIRHQLEVLALVRRLAEEGRWVVLALHDLCLALTAADDVAVLGEGRLLALGGPEAVYQSKVLERVMGVRLDRSEGGEKNAYRFCYINDFPMYELDPATRQIGFTHNPFSMPQGGLEALEREDPLDILAYQYDIVCNGVELSSGAVRNHDMDIMVRAFAIAGYDEEALKSKFGALYQAFQFGAPPHAGMAPGIDRMLMLLKNEENIREVIAFPMSSSAQDLMCSAPNDVTEQQLREVHIKVRE